MEGIGNERREQTMTTNPRLWTVSETALSGLDAVGARDLMVECFLQAQGTTFNRSARPLDVEGTETELRETVRAAVRLKFQDLGCDYDHPTPEDIGVVAAALAEEARSWGTPDDIVEHHIAQMHVIRTHIESM